jgi:hypothetical protein
LLSKNTTFEPHRFILKEIDLSGKVSIMALNGIAINLYNEYMRILVEKTSIAMKLLVELYHENAIIDAI